ncbi:MAG: hypothetical protein ACXW3M_09000 [Rhodoplanes sp.]
MAPEITVTRSRPIRGKIVSALASGAITAVPPAASAPSTPGQPSV